MKLIYIFLCILFLFNIEKTTSQNINCQSHKASATASSIYYSAENLRSDTIDIIKYTINLDITDFANQKIKGNTVIRFAPKLNGQNKISLDLLKMTIDSITQNATKLTYTYNDTLLRANLITGLNTTGRMGRIFI